MRPENKAHKQTFDKLQKFSTENLKDMEILP